MMFLCWVRVKRLYLAGKNHSWFLPRYTSLAKLIRTSDMGKEALEELSGDEKRVEMSGLYLISKKFEPILEVRLR
jgi:hypothetical protein